MTGSTYAIRKHRAFTPTDLVASVHAAHPDVDLAVARRYCGELTRAGYLRCVEKAIHGKNEARYRLKNDSGPKAPRMRRMTVLVDPNLGRVVWAPEALS